ncbi:MAG: DUF3891 family protein [Pedobacter sp.]
MIVNYTESCWEIITQRSHGLLAAQICAHWKIKPLPDRWVETLIATAEHDDVYNEFETDDLLNDKGGPVNFKETEFREDFCEKLIKMAETKSVYIALLISRHICFVYEGDAKATQFCKDLKKQEKRWLKVSGITLTDINAAYDLLQFCDAFSLLICQGLIQPEQRKIEISRGPDGKAYEMRSSGSGKISISPWPFDEAKFTVSYERRTLSKLVFTNLEDFRNEVLLANVNVENIELIAP